MTLRFAITWDYRCPFARIAHDHVVEGILDGADWEVSFIPFSLGQVHVVEGEPDVWDEPGRDSGLLALQAGTVVRDRFPDRFPRLHRALFDARHRDGLDLRDGSVVVGVLESNQVDAEAVLEEIRSGAALATVRRDHEAAARDNDVWGVPTFISDGRAAFVRLMEGAGGDAAVARRTVERVVATMTEWPELNELKHTNIGR